MKKVLFTLILITGSILLAQAQPGRGAEERAQALMVNFTDPSMSYELKFEISEILAKQIAATDQLGEPNLGRGIVLPLSPKALAYQQTADAQILALLNAQQKIKYTNYMKERDETRAKAVVESAPLVAAARAALASQPPAAQGGGRQGQPAGAGGGRGGTPEQRAQMMLSQLPPTLLLTTDQKTQIIALYTAQSKSQDDMRAAANGDFQSIQPKIAALTADTDAKILALLNATQKTQYQSYVSSRPAGGRGGGGRGAGAGAGGGEAFGTPAPGVPWDGGGVFPGGGVFVPRGE
jgi:protein CpxP